MNNKLYLYSRIDDYKGGPVYIGGTSLKFYLNKTNENEELINYYEHNYNMDNLERGNRE